MKMVGVAGRLRLVESINFVERIEKTRQFQCYWFDKKGAVQGRRSDGRARA